MLFAPGVGKQLDPIGFGRVPEKVFPGPVHHFPRSCALCVAGHRSGKNHPRVDFLIALKAGGSTGNHTSNIDAYKVNYPSLEALNDQNEYPWKVRFPGPGKWISGILRISEAGVIIL